MAGRERRTVARNVLRRYPHTFAEEAGITSLDSPSALFRLLVMAMDQVAA